MTTINRDRSNPGRCHTVSAGALLMSEDLFKEVRRCQDVRQEFSDACAATVASWWHGPSGRGAVFSRLSHRINGGVGVTEILDAIYDAQRQLDNDERPAREVLDDRLALDMLSTWACNGPPPRAFNDPIVDCCGRDAADCDCDLDTGD